MGLKMDDLHMPSVASSRSIGNAASDVDGENLKDLIAKKDKIENELKALSSVLDSHGVHMNTTLTTFDGYPRDDIDIAQIRTTRARIIPLRNDYKAIMAKIEAGLHAYWERGPDPEDGTVPTSTQPKGVTSGATGTRREADHTVLPDAPFAKVNSVITGSPADDAGLQAGDEVLTFGQVNFMNHEKLSRLAHTMQQNQGQAIPVKVSRKGNDGLATIHDLRLTPKNNWGGRGMLGCHLLPM